MTSIGVDHADYLGDTRESVAYEKAGIFRQGKPALCGDIDPPHTLLDKVRFAGHHQIAAQPSGDGHAAKATDTARHHAHHRLVLAQIDNRRVDIGNRRQAEVGFLQAHAASLQQQYRARRDALAVVFSRQFQGTDRKSTRLNSSHGAKSRMPSSA